MLLAEGDVARAKSLRARRRFDEGRGSDRGRGCDMLRSLRGTLGFEGKDSLDPV